MNDQEQPMFEPVKYTFGELLDMDLRVKGWPQDAIISQLSNLRGREVTPSAISMWKRRGLPPIQTILHLIQIFGENCNLAAAIMSDMVSISQLEADDSQDQFSLQRRITEARLQLMELGFAPRKLVALDFPIHPDDFSKQVTRISNAIQGLDVANDNYKTARAASKARLERFINEPHIKNSTSVAGGDIRMVSSSASSKKLPSPLAQQLSELFDMLPDDAFTRSEAYSVLSAQIIKMARDAKTTHQKTDIPTTIPPEGFM